MSATTKKPAAEVPREKTVIGTRLVVWRNVHTEEPKASTLYATIFPAGWDWDETGTTVELYDWKWDKEAGTIYVRGEIRRSSGSRCGINGTFPATMETTDIPKPRGNWVWSAFDGRWRNTSTGERRQAF